jgi:ERCC4-type nuclease|tara:strand:- start:756 stop:1667 length:912 start_codon:yes stop_codon:yes gene_type:complete
MKLIIDNREHDLFEKCELKIMSQSKPDYVVLSKEVLTLGDILIQTDDGKDVLLIERKSFRDLLASVKDGRYKEQSYRLTHSSGFPPHSIIYLLEGMFSQISSSETKLVYSCMTSLQYFKGFSVHRTSTLDETANWLLYLTDKIEREFQRGRIPYYLTSPYIDSTQPRQTEDYEGLNPFVNNLSQIDNREPEQQTNYCSVVKKVKKDNITPNNIGEIILCQIPGISSITAVAIMQQFNNFPHLIEQLKENPQCIDNITYDSNGKTRKVNKKSIENIRIFLTSSSVTEPTTEVTDNNIIALEPRV